MTAAVIRRPMAGDAARIAAIHRASRAAAMPWLRIVHTPEEDLGYFRDWVLPTSDVWAAELGGAVLGFAARREGWLDHLYVAPEAFGGGLGGRLLSAAQAGQQHLQLWTFQRNAGARRFYERRGFAAAELTSGAGNEESEPDVRYIWIAS